MPFARLLFRLILSLTLFWSVCVCNAGIAFADTTTALIDTPPGAQVIRIRWPESTLSPAASARLIAFSDANGQALPFSLVVAPEDQGHVLKPMWLVARLNNQAPYRLDVGSGVSGKYVKDADELIGRHLDTLAALPLAVIQPEAWGPITASLQDAQNTQQASDTDWRYWVISLAVATLVILAAIIAFFSSRQSRRDDIGKL